MRIGDMGGSLGTVLAISLMVLVGRSAQGQEVLFYDGFEDGKVAAKSWAIDGGGVVTWDGAMARRGVGSVRMEVDRAGGSEAYRAEIRLREAGAVRMNGTYEYQFSIAVESDALTTTMDEIVAQWWAPPDATEGETGRRRPAVSLHLNRPAGQWELVLNSDARRVLREKSIARFQRRAKLGPTKSGVWEDWRVRVRWSHTEEGSIRVWRDDNVVADFRGPTTYNDAQPPVWKLGLYKPLWRERAQRDRGRRSRVYVDEARIIAVEDP